MRQPKRVRSKTRLKLQAAIRNLVNAEVNDSWKGGGDPEMIPIYEVRLKHAKKYLAELLDKIEPHLRSLDNEKVDPLKQKVSFE